MTRRVLGILGAGFSVTESAVGMIIVVKYAQDDHSVTSRPLNVATGSGVSLIAYVVNFELQCIKFKKSRPLICFVNCGILDILYNFTVII